MTTLKLAVVIVLITMQTVAANAVGAGAQTSRPSLDLSGTWEFQVDPHDVGRAEKWFEPGKAFSSSMPVPAAWNAHGATFPSDELLREYEQKSRKAESVAGPERESDKLFHVYPGPAWYRRSVTVPASWKDKTPLLILHGVHRQAEVWVNGQPVGSHHSYLTPFRINVSRYAAPGQEMTIVIRVDGRRQSDIDPLMGCMDTVDFLHVTWGGIHQTVTLEARPATWIDDVHIVPDLQAGQALVRVSMAGAPPADMALVTEIRDAAGVCVTSETEQLVGVRGTMDWTARIPEPKPWSPQAPHLYTAHVRLLAGDSEIDSRSVRFGMREFKISGRQFLLNGKPIFLRGYGDDCIFPNTICPPADKEEFRKRLSAARDYGFNYVRHHSWTPPEEYLDAADELGMMLQPEFPFAYKKDLPVTSATKAAAVAQWREMIRLNRNHPSIVTWCMGNELYDSFDIAPEMYRAAKELDPTRPVIDTDGCRFGESERKTLDYLVVPFSEENSMGLEPGKYNIPENVTKPVIGHEMGYFVTLPDLTQIDLFKEGLRPYWLCQARDLAARKKVEHLYPDWLKASYQLQAACLKTNIEAARRSGLSGTSVWLFQDYPNCAEGVVDMFLRPKGVSAEDFRRFNAPTVLLLDAPRRSWWAGEDADIKFAVSRFEDPPSDAATLRWELRSADEVITSGLRELLHVGSAGIQELLGLRLEMPDRQRAERLVLRAEMIDESGTTRNEWNLWVFPRDLLSVKTGQIVFSGCDALAKLYSSPSGDTSPTLQSSELLVTTGLDARANEYLRGGGRVLLLNPEPGFKTEKTNYRLSSWDGGGPSGTIIDQKHAALREMPSEGWCDLHFYPLIQGSKTIFLDELPDEISPIARCVDRPNRLAECAYLFEARAGAGRLLVSGFNFVGAVGSDDPAATFLFDRLIRYTFASSFDPQGTLPE